MTIHTISNSLVGLVAGGTPIRGPGRDYRWPGIASGYVNNRVMFKATPTSPEAPFKNARVWLLRVPDGYKAWEGFSDANGYYTATNLEIGVEYIATAVDPDRNHKTVGAGPVTAVAMLP